MINMGPSYLHKNMPTFDIRMTVGEAGALCGMLLAISERFPGLGAEEFYKLIDDQVRNKLDGSRTWCASKHMCAHWFEDDCTEECV